jgi:hypothetical protein
MVACDGADQARARVSAASSRNYSMSAKCSECARPQPQTKLPRPHANIMFCDECHAPFSIEEIKTLFSEANLLDSNVARQFRRVIIDHLIAERVGMRVVTEAAERACDERYNDSSLERLRMAVDAYRGPK